MKDASRVKVATAVTALFLGGITAAGLISRSPADPATVSSAQTEVVHRKKVRTVRAPSAPAASQGASYAVPPAPLAAPQPVSTRVSPTAGEDDDYSDDDGGGEHEGEGESE